MHAPRLLFAVAAAVQLAAAWQLPFGLGSGLFGTVTAQLSSDQVPLAVSVEQEPEQPSNRIAIIGAGAAGSSAAFWISKAKERWGLDVEIDVFEANDYVGGSESSICWHIFLLSGIKYLM